jgi:hypothetical protein
VDLRVPVAIPYFVGKRAQYQVWCVEGSSPGEIIAVGTIFNHEEPEAFLSGARRLASSIIFINHRIGYS